MYPDRLRDYGLRATDLNSLIKWIESYISFPRDFVYHSSVKLILISQNCFNATLVLINCFKGFAPGFYPLMIKMVMYRIFP